MLTKPGTGGGVPTGSSWSCDVATASPPTRSCCPGQAAWRAGAAQRTAAGPHQRHRRRADARLVGRFSWVRGRRDDAR